MAEMKKSDMVKWCLDNGMSGSTAAEIIEMCNKKWGDAPSQSQISQTKKAWLADRTNDVVNAMIPPSAGPLAGPFNAVANILSGTAPADPPKRRGRPPKDPSTAKVPARVEKLANAMTSAYQEIVQNATPTPAELLEIGNIAKEHGGPEEFLASVKLYQGILEKYGLGKIESAIDFWKTYQTSVEPAKKNKTA